MWVVELEECGTNKQVT